MIMILEYFLNEINCSRYGQSDLRRYHPNRTGPFHTQKTTVGEMGAESFKLRLTRQRVLNRHCQSEYPQLKWHPH